MKFKTALVMSSVGLSLLASQALYAATITEWNTSNVAVGTTPADGVTGFSTIYNGDPSVAASSPTGRIAYTPPEAVAPGIQVQEESYTQGGPGGITLDGCLMTSNPGATCTSPFQSGKRIKQQMTGFAPLDLVFDIANKFTEEGADTSSTYQVFHRLINLTGAAAAGFVIELGFGIGGDFVQAAPNGGVSFASSFRAQPTGSGPASTQFPFGLFGEADDNPNFSLDGFFAPERAGMTVAFSETKIQSTGIFGPYASLFGNWLSQDKVPEGAFWDNDNNAATDALLMAWLNADGKWEVRRDVADITLGTAVSLLMPETFNTFADVVARLGLGGALSQGEIEDLANLNVNFAIQLNNLNATSFTLRTTMIEAPVAAVPLPAGAPLLLLSLGALAMLRRRRSA